MLVMHRLDQVDDSGDAGDGQLVDPAKIGSVYPALLDHGRIIVIEADQVFGEGWQPAAH